MTPTTLTTATTIRTPAAARADLGRITGLAADNAGNVYAAGAMGGVWRSTTGGGKWTPIAGAPFLVGRHELVPTARSGSPPARANTGGTSYVRWACTGSPKPTSGKFSPSNRVGGTRRKSA